MTVRVTGASSGSLIMRMYRDAHGGCGTLAPRRTRAQPFVRRDKHLGRAPSLRWATGYRAAHSGLPSARIPAPRYRPSYSIETRA